MELNTSGCMGRDLGLSLCAVKILNGMTSMILNFSNYINLLSEEEVDWEEERKLQEAIDASLQEQENLSFRCYGN